METLGRGSSPGPAVDFLCSRSGRSATLCPGHHFSTGEGGLGLQEPI